MRFFFIVHSSGIFVSFNYINRFAAKRKFLYDIQYIRYAHTMLYSFDFNIPCLVYNVYYYRMYHMYADMTAKSNNYLYCFKLELKSKLETFAGSVESSNRGKSFGSQIRHLFYDSVFLKTRKNSSSSTYNIRIVHVLLLYLHADDVMNEDKIEWAISN